MYNSPYKGWKVVGPTMGKHTRAYVSNHGPSRWPRTQERHLKPTKGIETHNAPTDISSPTNGWEEGLVSKHHIRNTQMQRPIYVGSLGATIRHKPNPSRALRLLEKHTRKVMKEEIDCLSNLKREPGVANQQRQYQTRNPHYSSKGCKNMA